VRSQPEGERQQIQEIQREIQHESHQESLRKSRRESQKNEESQAKEKDSMHSNAKESKFCVLTFAFLTGIVVVGLLMMLKGVTKADIQKADKAQVQADERADQISAKDENEPRSENIHSHVSGEENSENDVIKRN